MAKVKIRAYTNPAGGWGALEATGKALVEQDIPVRGAATLLRMNQPMGFDCPGCAWPDPKKPGPFEFCENGAKAMAWEATAKRCTPDFFAAHTVSELETWSDYELEMVGRITHPMRYEAASDRYVPVAWDEAFARIGTILREGMEPDQAEFYTSGRASNEAAFLFQLFGRAYGTNNFPDCSNMCHEATSVGLPQSIGVGKGTVLLEDFDRADAILIFGQNPGTNSPRMMTSLRDAARRNAAILSFNPFPERALERFQAPQNPVEMASLTSTPISSRIFQVRVGGDAAALKGIMKACIAMDDAAIAADEARVLDVDFIAGHTKGFEALAADLRSTSWAAIERRSGLTRADLESAARTYVAAENAILVWGMGITQHRRGTENVRLISNLALLRGNVGRPGAGLCPVRGHSNVQGNRTVGITEKPTPEMLDRIRDAFGFEPPRAHGHDVVAALGAMLQGQARAFIALGGNFAAAVPDTESVQQAMRTLDLTVAINTKLNRGQLVHGREAYILPCLARSEVDHQATGPQSITVEDSMSMVHASAGRNMPASEHLMSETAIVAGIARATLGPGSAVPWEDFTADYDRIRDAIERVFPIFQGFNARIRVPGGFHLTSLARERIWATPSGRAEFAVFEGLEEDALMSDPGALWLTTMRSHDQYNTTLYSLSDRYRGVFGGRMVVFLSESEMARQGVRAGDRVALDTIADDGVARSVEGFQVVPYRLPDGCVGAYYPEANPLVPLGLHDPQSHTPSFKAIPVRMRRLETGAA
ncbi:FdhF/YdeP family oxidoreductase [Methylobacterium sp. WL18]|uniref:FdhF/YdeP family oxidoreductase n=1 Tax=Methylobacterium sp. WL18 TaxID=2603897 RepID=UPI0011CA02ED|nr:FdhF/YdeP family oxidoreductase [Methylobacterium sp. WL18]TXN75456.1 FdhF/YdeP family oxidoreductase [Methylobacterium sp. WL18]